uniref:F-box/LRR-repeat protein 3-like n=1 Tax=Saccoglossus kowalevskii TaxID=10224 RepID=A0ABM0MP01_SACKO|nr:PREDICTED: F-box/LRR-repeat protein 3-like [Saccoglossus kowalevskii]
MATQVYDLASKISRGLSPNDNDLSNHDREALGNNVAVNDLKPTGCSLDTCSRCRSELDQFSRLPDEVIACHILPKLDIFDVCMMKCDNCWRAVTEANLLTISKKSPKLRALTTSHNQSVTDFSILMLAQNCPLLQELDLSSCFNCHFTKWNKVQHENEQGFHSFTMLFKLTDESICMLAGICKNLRELHLSSNYGVTDVSVIELAENCTSLEELDVSYCYKVTDKGLREFCNNEESKLKLLRIKNCNDVSPYIA